MADKCIGKLTLDITDIQKKVAEVNAELAKLGVTKPINISTAVAAEVKKQLSAIESAIKASVKTIQDSANQAANAFSGAFKGASTGSLASEITETTSLITTLGRTTDITGATVEAVVKETRKGFNSLGQSIREITDANGNITTKIVDMKNQYKDALKIMTDYYSKAASLYGLQQNGQGDSARATKLASEVQALQDKWSKVSPAIQAVVMKTDEATRAAKLYADTIAIIDKGVSTKNAEQALSNLVTLYQQYYKYMADASTYAQKGDVNNADMYNALALGIKGYIDAIAKLNPSLDAQAQAEQEVVKAHLAYETAMNSTNLKEQQQNTEAYTNALIRLYQAQADFNNQVASGKLVEGTDKYTKTEAELNRLESEAIKAGQALDQMGREAVMNSDKVAAAFGKLNISEGGLVDSSQLTPLQQIKQAYTDLTNAIERYNIAKKNKDDTGMTQYQNEINAQMQVVAGIEQAVNASNMEAHSKQEILNLIERCRIAQDKHNAGIQDGTAQTSELGNQVNSILTRYFSLVAVIRTINSLIKSTTEYVSEYYDKMNEIRVITKSTEAEAERLGDTYRKMAADMSVSSLDMADAAIYFTRQGLGAAEVEKRLRSTTEYAKTANIEFETAAELITAVVNSMNLVDQEAETGREAAERVADVFLMVGDNAATSGEEIGTAMQKAAAAAGAFGVEFEWLASYIATVSETTRQEASSIGTAFNTLIARLHNIRTTGYNSEDETKINDIQKALANINVTLLDQEGNWRDMTTIFNEIAAQWDTLDGKTKSYIATTMAGVKQQNVFLALMDDLSQKEEGTSRAWELHAKAMESAGTAQEKYAIYTESVTAAQERLTVAQERFYSLLDANIIKGWYSTLANIVTMVDNGAEALDGWNIKLPLIAAGVAAVILVLKNLSGIMTVLSAHPIILTIAGVTAGVTALIGVLSWLGDVIDTQSEKYERASERLNNSMKKVKEYGSLKTDAAKMFEELESGAISAKDGLDEYNSTLDKLAKLSPEAKKAVDNLKNGIGEQSDAVHTLNEELQKQIELQQRLAIASLRDKYANWSGGEENTTSVYGHANREWDTIRYNGKDFQPWGDAMFESLDAFSQGLRDMFDAPGGQRYNYLGFDLEEYITSQLKDLNDMDYADRWPIIGQRVWEKFFGGGDIRGVSEVMTNSINEMIDEVVSQAGYGLDKVDAGILRQRLIEKIFGADGEISSGEYAQAGKRISEMMVELASNGYKFEPSAAERLEYIGQEIFGEAFKSMYGDLDQIAAQNPEIANEISAAYQELLEAGFKNADIQGILTSLPIDQWGNMVTLMKDQMKASLTEVYGEGLADLFGDSWDDLGFSTLTLVDDLAKLGVPIESINAAAKDTESLEEFIANLKVLKSTVASGEGNENPLANYAKDIKNYAEEIKSIDTILGKLNDKKAVGISDILGLAKAHPELLQSVNDVESLKAALLELRNSIQDDTAESVRNYFLTDEDYFKGTEYYQNLDDGMKKTIHTMKDYLDYIGEEDEQYQKINDDIDGAAEGMIRLEAETASTGKSMKEAASDVKTFSNDIKTIDSIIDKIGQGKNVSINDIFSLATSYPELLQYTEGVEGLDKALMLLRGDLEDKARSTIKNAILDSSEYFQGTDYYAGLDDAQKASITTMREYLETLNQEDEEYQEVTASVDAATESMIQYQNAEDGTGDSTENLIKSIKSATQEMNKIDSLIKSLNKDGSVDFEDLLNLAAAHPEIVGAISDINSLKAALENLRRTDTEAVVGNLRSMMTGSEDALKNSPFAGMSWIDDDDVEHTAKTMDDIIKNAEYIQQNEIDALNRYLDQAIASFLASSNQLGSVSKDILGQWMENLFPESNVDLLNRKAVQMGDDIATVLTETITASADGHEGIKWNQDIICNFTPITPDGQYLDDDTFFSYIDDLFKNSANLDELWENDKVENGGKGLLISADVDFESFEAGIENAETLTELLHLLQEAYYGVDEANKTWLETQMEQIEQNEENNWAQTNGYIEQLSEIQTRLNEFGGQAALDYFNSLDDTMKKGIASTYPNVIKKLAEMEKALKDGAEGTKDLKDETDNLNKALQKSKDYAGTKYFQSSAKAIKDLEEGTISATDAYDIFYKEVDKVTKAQEDITDVTEKMRKKTAVTVSDVSNLAGVLGLTADEVINDFPSAVAMFDELIGAGGDLESMFNALNDAAFIRITGTSDADFSAIEAGLLSVQGLADETIQRLIATGQWQVETLTLPQEGFVFDPKTGKWTKTTINAHQSVLKPTGGNPFKGRSSGRSSGGTKRSSGGGGGSSKSNDSDSSSSSSSSSNEMTEIERMLDMMTKINDIQNAQLDYYKAQEKYYSQTGRIQGVIAYMERQKEVLDAQNKTLAENVEQIEAEMEAKRAEVKAMDIADEGYEEAADDLDKLQDAHQDYTKQLVENRTEIERLNESIKEQNRKVRQMEIDLRNTILKAIQDREAKAKRMLQGEIDMENTILDLIQKRYEKERDQILETTQLKIDSLNEEKNLLAEQLQLRREQAEEEDKAAELANLEGQYARISADPTRAKEALEIRKKIADLRQEMAWDEAEKEVQAQQDSLDQQITSLEDYMQYIEDYYEDLFEHPKKLIEEMREIMSQSDEEIIEWLKRNSEEYIEATEASQRSMVSDWKSTLLDMRGELELHWDEVEDIISKGDEYIIEFLKENSAEYAAAGKLQAEAYVDEWTEQLENLRKAHEQVAADIAANYEAIRAAAESAQAEADSDDDSSSGGGGSSGGGRSSGGGNFNKGAKKIAGKVKDFADKIGVGGGTSSGGGFFGNVMDKIKTSTNLLSGGGVSKGNNKLMLYATGGMADYTGPAWLDGSPQAPERVLSPKQTALFETMVQTLEQMSRISIPSMPAYSGVSSAANPVSVGDIIVNVSNLDTDDDYEEMADKVGEVLMDRMNRTAVVGGMRVSSF